MAASAVHSVLIRETPGAAWYRVTFADGTVRVVSIPKREEG